ncbi:MAG: TlpA disulfide reductase family protein [Anaerolineales bacterium]|jgi:cytochrome c biogenesis protein CcmG/thiol:disulfide interchange protein DsbE
MTDEGIHQELESEPQDLPEAQQQSPRRRWGFALVWLFVIALLVVVGVSLIRTQEGHIQVGEPVPDLSLQTFEGETIRFSDLRGEVVVVNFWASWCRPCEQEAAELQQAYELYRDDGVWFLGVDYVDTETEAKTYLQRFGITYPNGPDLGTRISQAFRIRGVPETYIIGPDGRLAAFKIGPYQSLDEIIQQIESVRAQ